MRPRTRAGGTSKTAAQPAGVVTIPTANVSPSGSFTAGRSCGPMRKPRSARNGTPRPSFGTCRIGSPRTNTATVDPVGAIFSRAYGAVPRAYQIDSTTRSSGAPTGRILKSNVKGGPGEAPTRPP